MEQGLCGPNLSRLCGSLSLNMDHKLQAEEEEFDYRSKQINKTFQNDPPRCESPERGAINKKFEAFEKMPELSILLSKFDFLQERLNILQHRQHLQPIEVMKQIRQRVGFYQIYSLCDRTELIESGQKQETSQCNQHIAMKSSVQILLQN